MISRAFVGSFALAAGTAVCVCSAHAADLPVRPAPAPVVPVVYAPPVYNWSGFYIGGNVGGGFANSSGPIHLPAPAIRSARMGSSAAAKSAPMSNSTGWCLASKATSTGHR
ncbi:MAG TPA: hypothetical protein VEI98_01200 [Xanthobacteraceae bacterium]|nr:hypothetical protein [Xanthobacteraceae bacterium]